MPLFTPTTNNLTQVRKCYLAVLKTIFGQIQTQLTHACKNTSPGSNLASILYWSCVGLRVAKLIFCLIYCAHLTS